MQKGYAPVDPVNIRIDCMIRTYLLSLTTFQLSSYTFMAGLFELWVMGDLSFEGLFDALELLPDGLLTRVSVKTSSRG
jgi:hypothetical protein